MSNSLDPDQAQHFVGPNLDPNGLQRLSADDTSRQRVNDQVFLSVFHTWVKVFRIVPEFSSLRRTFHRKSAESQPQKTVIGTP